MPCIVRWNTKIQLEEHAFGQEHRILATWQEITVVVPTRVIACKCKIGAVDASPAAGRVICLTVCRRTA
jgi:hypothetical protein